MHSDYDTNKISHISCVCVCVPVRNYLRAQLVGITDDVDCSAEGAHKTLLHVHSVTSCSVAGNIVGTAAVMIQLQRWHSVRHTAHTIDMWVGVPPTDPTARNAVGRWRNHCFVPWERGIKACAVVSDDN